MTTRAGVVLAPNPGPMTLDGTNTWVLREPGTTGCLVVDPGPLDEAHLAAVRSAVAHVPAPAGTSSGVGPSQAHDEGLAEAVLLTHRHLDHSEGARRLADLLDVPVLAADPDLADRVLSDGEQLLLAGLRLDVVATPGHSSDSVSFVLPEDHAVLTGDTVLGRGTTVVAHPDGRLGDYLASLRRLAALDDLQVLPGHGPELPSSRAVTDAYLRHREGRLAAVRAAWAAGAMDARAVVETVYADVDRSLWDAAELSVRSQLQYLQENQYLQETERDADAPLVTGAQAPSR